MQPADWSPALLVKFAKVNCCLQPHTIVQTTDLDWTLKKRGLILKSERDKEILFFYFSSFSFDFFLKCIKRVQPSLKSFKTSFFPPATTGHFERWAPFRPLKGVTRPAVRPFSTRAEVRQRIRSTTFNSSAFHILTHPHHSRTAPLFHN